MSRESAFYIVAVIAMQNHTAQPVSVTRYQLDWPGGSFVGPTRALELAANESRDWRVRLYHGSGDIDALLKHPETSRVIILEANY